MSSISRVGLVLSVIAASIAILASSATAAPPVVSIDPTVEDVSYRTATVKGTFDPADAFSYYSFEYQELPGGPWSGFAFDGFDEAGTGSREVSKELTELKPGTEYAVRLAAWNFEDPEVYSAEPDPTFTTVAVPNDPVVTVDPATDVAYTTAHLSGQIDPEESPIPLSYYFEYSQDPGTEGWTSAGFGELSGPEAEGTDPVEVEVDLTDLKPGAEYFFRLVASNGHQFTSPEPNPSFETGAISPPVVTIDPVTSFDAHSAQLSGTINPQAAAGDDPGFNVRWRFECTPSCGESLRGEIDPPADGDNTNHVVEAEAVDLDPNTEYEVRLIAENAGGSAEDETSFTTEAPAPFVQTLPAAVIGVDSAWIGGKVNPRNSPTTYYIEYSVDPSFAGSTKVPAGEDGDAGSGNESQLVNFHAVGLEKGTTYYYRVIATGAGTTTGETRSFTTLVAPAPVIQGLPDGRVYEKVTPADKNGGGAWRGSAATFKKSQASRDGNAFSYVAVTNFGGQGAPTFSAYLARRGPGGGWNSEGISPLAVPNPSLPANNSIYLWMSNDLSRGVLDTFESPYNPGDPSGWNIYLRNNATGGATLMRPTPGAGYLSGVSEDETHFVLGSSGGEAEMIWSQAHGLQPFAINPDGTPAEGASLAADYPGNQDLGQFAIAPDGSHVFFRVSNDETNFQRVLYRRDLDLNSTTLVSASEKSGVDPDEPQQGDFELASRDGSVAVFQSSGELTDDSVVRFGTTLYRWDENAPVGSRLTEIAAGDEANSPRVLGTVGANEDASIVYFAALGKLTPDAERNIPNLYVWKQGEGVDLVATLDGGRAENGNYCEASIWGDRFDGQAQPEFATVRACYSGEGGTYRLARNTPDGKILTFASRESLTAYDTDGYTQIYRYDSESGETLCITCSPFQSKSKSNSLLIRTAFTDDCACGANSFHEFRDMSADGSRLIFDSREPLLPQDTNGKNDVYEWKDGRLALISTGSSGAHSLYVDASPSGNDIFFATQEQLVPSDRDTADDIYDARIGGVPEPTVRPPCVGDECQGTPTQPGNFQTPGSATFNGPGSARAKNCGAIRKRATKAANRSRRIAKRARQAQGATARKLSTRAAKERKRAAGLKKQAQRCAKGRQG